LRFVLSASNHAAIVGGLVNAPAYRRKRGYQLLVVVADIVGECVLR
jgi:hypothetical protein